MTFYALGTLKAKKEKKLYWRNPTDPKIRPDPRFFYFIFHEKREKRLNKIAQLKAVLFIKQKTRNFEMMV